MSAAKHTPGPLQAIHWTRHAATTVVKDDPSAFAGKRVIAECDTEDDARLFAAAPDLLEALKVMLDAFVEDPLDRNTDAAIEQAYDAIEKAVSQQKPTGRYASPFWTALDAAIAKARGEA